MGPDRLRPQREVALRSVPGSRRQALTHSSEPIGSAGSARRRAAWADGVRAGIDIEREGRSGSMRGGHIAAGACVDEGVVLEEPGFLAVLDSGGGLPPALWLVAAAASWPPSS